MMRFIFATVLFVVFFGQIGAQSTAFVFQGGLTVGLQKWDNSFDREPLLAYHGDLAIESVNNEDDRSSIFAQIGYHIKGSATRFRFFNINSGFPSSATFTERFEFRNLSLILGAKQKFNLGASGRARYYYFGGIRGDYTLSTNIDELASRSGNVLFYPLVGFMNRWMVGISAGGGLEFNLNEVLGGEVKLSLHPDFTLQYNQPSIRTGYTNPYNGGQQLVIDERRIRNTAIELSVGLRLLRKVVYVE